MFASTADELFEVERRHARVARLRPPSRIQDFEDGESHMLLDLEVVFGISAARDQFPTILPLPQVADVVFCPALGVAEHPIGLAQGTKLLFVASPDIVRMQALGKKPVDPVDCVGLGICTDLQYLVIVDWFVIHEFDDRVALETT
jgi:hypothetical protein